MRYKLAAIVRRLKPCRRKPIRVPAITFPRWQEDELLALMVDVLRAYERAYRARVLPTYELRPLDAPMGDAPPETSAAIDAADDEVARLVLTLTPALRDWVIRRELGHREAFGRNVKNATGVDLQTLVGLSANPETMESVLARLVNLVRGLSDDTRKNLAETVWRGYTNRTPRTQMAREIRESLQTSRSRAILIARDQTLKLAARLDQERQEEAGFDRYIWRHSRKARPRQTHVARNGKVFEWKKPPADGHPGFAINCGCKAEAYMEWDEE